MLLQQNYDESGKVIENIYDKSYAVIEDTLEYRRICKC